MKWIDKYILHCIIAAALVYRLAIIFLSGDDLFARWGSDDLFYYTKLASNVWEYGCFTFDGEHVTNGFQPLFMMLLIPVAPLFDNPISTMQIVLVFITITTMLSGIYLFKLARMFVGKGYAIICVSLFLFHPKLLSISFNGTEAALSMLMIVLVVYHINKKSLSWWKISGLMAMMVLTRIDLSVLLVASAVYAMLIKKESIQQWIKLALLPLLVTGLWCTINYITLGSFLPDSGMAKSVHATMLDGNLWDSLRTGMSSIFRSESSLSFTSIALIFIGAIFMFKYSNNKINSTIIVLLTAGGTILLLACLKMGTYREWYLMPVFLGAILMSTQGIYGIQNLGIRYFILPLAIAGWTVHAWKNPRIMLGNESLIMAQELQDKLPGGGRIGSYNAGIFGASLPSQFTLINLDGVVNNSAIKHLKNRSLDQYILQEDINYLLDYGSSIEFFERFQNSKFDYDTLITINTRISDNKLVLLKIK